MITNFNNYQLITEDPDSIYDRVNRTVLYSSANEALPFSCDISSNHKNLINVFFGRKGKSHLSVTKNEKGERGYPGRLWLDSKVIAFWVYPDDEMFKLIIKKIEEKKNIQIFNNGWRMEVQKKRGKIKKKKPNDDCYLNDGGFENTILIPIEEYAGSPDVPQEQLMMHLMKWQDKEKLKSTGKIKNWGSDKTSWDAPKNLPYRQAIYQENKIYEGIFDKYKLGDYVLYKPITKDKDGEDFLRRQGGYLDKEEFVKIVIKQDETFLNKIKYFPGGTTIQQLGWIVQEPNGKNWIALKGNIIRKLTPEEIDVFELRKNTDKYNL